MDAGSAGAFHTPIATDFAPVALSAPPRSALVVFGIIFVALVLFVTELFPNDVTAIGVIVSLVVLEPYTGVDATAGIQGFANPATVTIIAMYILSEGVNRTGIVERLGAAISRVTRGEERRLAAATVGTTGLSAGFVNNTPIVAVFIPMVVGLAERSGISPSKLLLPLSYAAMLGGTLTLIGTSTNILAGGLSRELLGRPIGMFEFTSLGIVVLVVGAAYLLTVGRRLTPERIPAKATAVDRFDVQPYLSRLVVRDDSPLVGVPIRKAFANETDASDAEGPIEDDSVALLLVERADETIHGSTSDRPIEPGDELVVRAPRARLRELAAEYGLRRARRATVTDETLRSGAVESRLVEALVSPESSAIGDCLGDLSLRDRYDATVLAVRRGEKLHHEGLAEFVLEPGDTLLLQTTDDGGRLIADDDEFLLTGGFAAELQALDAEKPEPLSPTAPIALSTMAGVVIVAGIGLLPIVIAALGGAFVMLATGCLTTSDAYEAVNWNVIFLLAGVIPLGLAMQATGGTVWLAGLLEALSGVISLVGLLLVFYVLTGLLSNVITPVASVILMIPVAVDTAAVAGGDPFSFLLGVMFASSAAFMTPVGYQTNLMVYGPGGYRFVDYLRVGGPLQFLIAIVVTVGIWGIWGVAA
ncbi:citrate transporter [Halalkaliarchaeum desulfuricum]|uniref:Citrate transporter n=1 Tax=Halalkaliarchaeum desulfuricum TaxID=2055893 RepID=A0A343TGG3_9EURY|nr:SLC13 family permease [Halalkaliarchaeum desulfuricum]AUX08185.1 citrate transporter [Halalkaliarchaeum desulfuricum]